MAVRVRIKNFQSIEDAEIEVDGFAVVTGPNNSGKTALMRAIRGLFINAPPGPLVRHGTNYLSVELEFDDGTTILWEKGTEKPEGKGATVNRYFVNGVKIEGVGRGAPPEIEALGVRQITAASHQVWPQIAQQFDGTLFLVDRPGSAVAEALSDVEKVGKLTGALKLSEKDKRANSSELTVRRKDVKALEAEVEQYLGLKDVTLQVAGLGATRTAAEQAGYALVGVRGLRDRYTEAFGTASVLSGFVEDVPDPKRATRLRDGLAACQGLRTRYRTALSEVAALAGAAAPDIPNPDRAQKLGEEKKAIDALRSRLRKAEKDVDDLAAAGVEAGDKATLAVAAVQDLLGDRGICPTCDTVHAPGAAHA